MVTVAGLWMAAISQYAAASGINSHHEHWMARIRQLAGPSCHVAVVDVTDRRFGYNGVMDETWTVSTCHGWKRYSLSYYPPASFPLRWDPYEVERIDLVPQ